MRIASSGLDDLACTAIGAAVSDPRDIRVEELPHDTAALPYESVELSGSTAKVP